MQCSDLKILKNLQITLSVLKYVQEDKNVFATILNQSYRSKLNIYDKVYVSKQNFRIHK